MSDPTQEAIKWKSPEHLAAVEEQSLVVQLRVVNRSSQMRRRNLSTAQSFSSWAARSRRNCVGPQIRCGLRQEQSLEKRNLSGRATASRARTAAVDVGTSAAESGDARTLVCIHFFFSSPGSGWCHSRHKTPGVDPAPLWPGHAESFVAKLCMSNRRDKSGPGRPRSQHN